MDFVGYSNMPKVLAGPTAVALGSMGACMEEFVYHDYRGICGVYWAKSDNGEKGK